jgi:hypothetical protein
METLLSENYQRVFKSIVILLEERLVQMELALLGFQFKLQVNIVWQDNMTQEEKHEIGDTITKMYEILKSFFPCITWRVKQLILRKQLTVNNTFLLGGPPSCKKPTYKGIWRNQ